MVEGARLEIVLPSTGYQGSNPCLSAIKSKGDPKGSPLFFMPKLSPFEPSHERHTVPRLQICAGCANALLRPLAQIWVRKSLSLRHKKAREIQKDLPCFFMPKLSPFEPSHERHSVPRLQVCAGLQNALRHPLAQTWVRKSLSSHLIESPTQ